jgi:KRAB domain-containing zinc finger protein
MFRICAFLSVFFLFDSLISYMIFFCRNVQLWICDLRGWGIPIKLRLGENQQVPKEKPSVSDKPDEKLKTNLPTKVAAAAGESPKPYSCKICKKGFKLKSNLEKHGSMHKERRFKCSMCSMTSPYKSTIEKHVAAVHDGIRFFCKHCNKLFKQHYYFRDHMKTHEPGYVDTSYKCDFCPKSFKTKHILKRHVKMHNAERDFFVCDVCGKKFTERGYFKTHMRVHTGEKPYVCDFCGKGFTLTKYLKTHVRVHTKEKPYSCDVCKKSFTQKGSLTIHKRYHTGERPYTCRVCAKGFVSKTFLNQHNCKGPK